MATTTTTMQQKEMAKEVREIDSGCFVMTMLCGLGQTCLPRVPIASAWQLLAVGFKEETILAFFPFRNK
mgnify:CR=1 FL=1